MTEPQRAQSPPDMPASRHGTQPDQQLQTIVDHCTTAKTLAEAIGDRFLSYLLAMALQEAGRRLGAPPPRDGD